MKKIIQRAFSILNATEKKRGLLIIVLLVLQSLLDFFSIASFLPVIFLIINPGFISSNEILKSAFIYFGFSSAGSFIIAITFLVLGFTFAKAIISYGISLVKARYIFGIATALSDRTLARYLETGYPGFSDADFSREVSRITNYPVTFANSLLLPLANLISEGLIFILIVACIVVYDIKIILLLIIVLIPFVVMYLSFKKNTNHISQNIKDKFPLYLKYAQQIVEALIEIKISAQEKFFSKRFTKTARELSEVFASDHIIQNSLIRFTEVIAGVIICVLVIYAVFSGQTYQQTILILTIYAGASFRIIPSINRILLASFQIRSHEYIVQELADLSNSKPAKPTEPSTESLLFSERLDLINLSFGYLNEHTILKNINLTIRRGTKVALTGKSGEGKTTLLLILLGFLKNYTGEIRIDSNIVSQNSLRTIMGYVPQNPYIMDGTIAENIAFGIDAENIDRSKIQDLLHELDLDGLIERLPEGIDSQIGERGVKLSGGQRQRITLARALYANADILLIDEATNQLHHSLEAEIMKLLDDLKAKGKTIVIITHKLSKHAAYDFIYRLEDGNLVESASFELI
ncbi:MAG TPA: ABC transporter ATP-binding protein [Ohtaekwangia sp.]